MSDHAVEANELTKKFGDFTAVDGITFDVPRGEVFGFLGPNGAGKSTTIRMLCGILEPTSGSGRVAGFDISRQPDKIKQHIGYMSQRFSLYGDLTVEENIEFYGGVYDVAPERLKQRKQWVLEVARLADRRQALTADLPVGWKQRLAFGCALVHQPEILFLDEPTAGVDPTSRREFWDLIYQIAEEGVTTFVTTHHMDEAEHCDRVGLIHGGKLIALDSPARLRSRPPTTTLLEVRCRPLMKALEVLEREPLAQEAALFGSALHLSVAQHPQAADRIEQTLRENGVEVQGIQPIAPSLEDVFISLIEGAEQAAPRT